MRLTPHSLIGALALIALSLLTACGGGSSTAPASSAPKTWVTAAVLDTAAGYAHEATVAVGPAGSGFAAWTQSNGSVYDIWIAPLNADGSSGTPAVFDTTALDAYGPQLGADANGNVMAVWYQYDGTRDNAWARRYTPTGGWDTAVLLETDNGNVNNPALAVAPGGQAVAVWNQHDGLSRFNIWANTYTPAGGWGTATLIENDNAGDARAQQVVMDGNGNAIAVWEQSDGTRTNIWANRYAAGTGWGTPTLLESSDSGPAQGPRIGMDSSGNAIAVWHQFDGTRTSVWASRYTVGSGWSSPVRIGNTDEPEATYPMLAMNANGQAVAVWQQNTGSRWNIWAARYTPSSGWGSAARIEANDAGDATAPYIAVDTVGNAIAVWSQAVAGGRHDIWAARSGSDGSWSTPLLIETTDIDEAYGPVLVVDALGNATVVWSQGNGTANDIWINRYR